MVLSRRYPRQNLPDGHQETIYMIYLIFDCVSANRDVTINEEFDNYAWSKPKISKLRS